MKRIKIQHLWTLACAMLLFLQVTSFAVYFQKQKNYSYSQDIEIAGSLRKLSQEMLVNISLHHNKQNSIYRQYLQQNMSEFDRKITYLLDRNYPNKYVKEETQLRMKQSLENLNQFWGTAKKEIEDLTHSEYTKSMDTLLQTQSKLLSSSQEVVDLLVVLDEENRSKLLEIQIFIFIMISLSIGIAWYIIQNVWIKQEQKTSQEKTELLFNIVKALCKTLEFRDPYTYGHSERVAHMAKMVAKEMGFDRELCFRVELEGYLHDIGKMGIPDDILNKNDVLTTDEYEVIKKHPLIGASIVGEVLEGMTDGVLYHHERFDGKGYPHNLKGSEIPIIARLMAIVDAYDAITSNRSYRKALTHEAALDILQKNEGTQFDPEILSVFLRIANQFEAKLNEKNSSLKTG